MIMVNKNKRKGTDWENLFVELVQKNVPTSKAKRIPGSGAMGTLMHEPILQGDVVIKFKGLQKSIRVDNKVGYGGDSQLTIKREWLNKIQEEARISNSIPAVVCKFSGAKSSGGVQHFIVLDMAAFYDIMNQM